MPAAWDGVVRALSIKQPYAAAIVLGFKPVENRQWSTNHRGELLVHAPAEPDPSASWLAHELCRWCAAQGVPLDQVRAALTRSAIVGLVDVTDCTRKSSSIWAADGQWHWDLDHPIIFKRPVPCSGQRGLWVPSRDVSAQVDARLAMREVIESEKRSASLVWADG